MKKEKVYYAHSTESFSESQWQILQNHLYQVAEMAANFACFFGSQEIARNTAKLHDLGKYTEAFDRRLRGGTFR